MTERMFAVYAAAYGDRDDADLDYEVVKRLYSAGPIVVYDATLFDRGGDGRPKTINTLAGLFFPADLVRQVSNGSSVRSIDGMFWRGLSAADLTHLTDLFHHGRAWLIVVAGAQLRRVLMDPARDVLDEFEKTLSADDGSWNVTTQDYGIL
jgi:hypothetical protein